MSLAGCHSMVRGDHPLCLEVASEPPSRVRRLAQTIGIFGKQKDSPHGAIQTPRGGSFREVSIHAPAWGATRVPQEYRHWSGISIHAPAWGATDALLADFQESILFQSTHPRGVRLLVMVMGCALNVFQSTHPRGVRQVIGLCVLGDLPVSIHAPTWGATALIIYQVKSDDYLGIFHLFPSF